MPRFMATALTLADRLRSALRVRAAADRRCGAARRRRSVTALLKQGADVNAAQGDGMTALHWAAMNGDAELAKMLIYAGANVRATTRSAATRRCYLASQRARAP